VGPQLPSLEIVKNEERFEDPHGSKVASSRYGLFVQVF